MRGGFSSNWDGAASGPPDGHWSRRKARSGGGSRSAGQSKKKAKNEGRTIVFIDESGLSQRPHRCRTWAPRGQTPVLQYHFNWKTLSAMAGVTWWNFYFRLYPGTIRNLEVIDFLRHLLRHLRGKLLIVWDGLRSHRSRMVWDFVRQQRGRLWLEFLPAYPPELNSVEYLWAHWKHHELPNFCRDSAPTSLEMLSILTRRGAYATLPLMGNHCCPRSPRISPRPLPALHRSPVWKNAGIGSKHNFFTYNLLTIAIRATGYTWRNC